MKLSTNSIKEKIKAHELSKVAEEKRLIELKKLEQAKSRYRTKVLKEIADKVLNAALEGASQVEIGVGCDAEINEISHILDDKFLEIKEVYYSDYLEDQLEEFLDSLSEQQTINTKILLFDSSRVLRKLCEEIKGNYSEYHEETMIHVIDLLSEIFKEDGVLIDQINSFNEGCLALQDCLEDISIASYSTIYSEVIGKLSKAFEGIWLTEYVDEELLVFFIKWESIQDDDVFNYEPTDDYFNTLGLAWIACTHGQLFVAALENLVEKKIEDGESFFKIRLYKHSSGYRIEMENGSEVYTLLDEVGLTRLFTKLGYKVKCSETSVADEVDLVISWSSVA